MTTPFSKYEILGRIVETVTHMPTDANQLALCNAVACSVWDYLQDPDIRARFAPIKLGKPETIKNIFDTEHVDDIPAGIKPKKPTISKMENVDPYAEQRKWVGKLCRFWDDNSKITKHFGTLTRIDEYAIVPYEAENGFWYCACEPVKLDDDIIYKGGDNE